MVYYGSLAADFARIAAVPPQVLVPGSLQMVQLYAPELHDAGVEVLAYVPTWWAGTQSPSGTTVGSPGALADVEAQVDAAMDAGADGIFFDQASSDAMAGTPEGSYYAQLRQYVKGYGAGKVVAVNPGVAAPDPSCFAVADIVCLECGWSSFSAAGYPGIGSERVWGLDSAGDCRNFDGGEAQAVADTASARALGVGRFYATDAYTDLPAWYESYAASASVCR